MKIQGNYLIVKRSKRKKIKIGKNNENGVILNTRSTTASNSTIQLDRAEFSSSSNENNWVLKGNKDFNLNYNENNEKTNQTASNVTSTRVDAQILSVKGSVSNNNNGAKKSNRNGATRVKNNSTSGVTLSWDNINVFCKRRRKCFCKKAKCCECCLDRKEEYKRGNLHYENKAYSNDIIVDVSDEGIVYQNSEPSNNSTNSSIKKHNPNQILNNVCGIVYPGQSLAIMGASGAGKTTLLNVLNFRITRKFIVNGNIRLNGTKVTADDLDAHVGFVPQDDLFIGTLTVYEHLKFMAMLKMPKKISKTDRMKRVDEVINEFKLWKCKNVLIGYPDKKGISGGEKRRLAFASEVLTDPQILFCDEPTSGLDSHMAKMVVNTISALAKKGKTIISTIHQPSSFVYEKFDLLCLLAEGRVAYFGERKHACAFFASLNYVCPPQYNPADYFIDILALKSSSSDSACKVQGICDSFEKSKYHDELLTQINTQEVSNDDAYKTKNHQKIKMISKTTTASYFTQFIWLFWRQFKSTIREPFATRILFIQSVVLGLFLGFTYFQTKNDQASVQNKNGLLFVMLMQSSLSYLFGVASQYHIQWSVTRLEVKNRVYSVILYFLAKTLAEVPQNIVFPIITVSIIYWTASIHSDIYVYLFITSIIVLNANASVGYGTFLAIVAPNLDGTVGLIGPTVLPLLIFSGFLINNDSIPKYFIWIKYISWLYYAYDGIMIYLWSHTSNIPCDGVSTLASNLTVYQPQCINTGDQVLDLLKVNKDNLNRDIVVLVTMVVVWPLLAGLILYLKSRFQ